MRNKGSKRSRCNRPKSRSEAECALHRKPGRPGRVPAGLPRPRAPTPSPPGAPVFAASYALDASDAAAGTGHRDGDAAHSQRCTRTGGDPEHVGQAVVRAWAQLISTRSTWPTRDTASSANPKTGTGTCGSPVTSASRRTTGRGRDGAFEFFLIDTDRPHLRELAVELGIEPADALDEGRGGWPAVRRAPRRRRRWRKTCDRPRRPGGC
jgi:hypothetical protein